MENPSPRKKRRIWPIVLVLALVGLVTLALVNREDQEAGLHEEIVYDDFGFQVVSVRTAETVGEDEQLLRAEGLFYVITLYVQHHGANMVPFQFDPEFVTLHDGSGESYKVSAAATQALKYFFSTEDPCAQQLRGGMSCATELVFEVPGPLTDPRVRVSISRGAFWKLLDLVFYGDKSIRIG